MLEYLSTRQLAETAVDIRIAPRFVAIPATSGQVSDCSHLLVISSPRNVTICHPRYKVRLFNVYEVYNVQVFVFKIIHYDAYHSIVAECSFYFQW